MRKTKRIVSVGILLLAAFFVWTFLIQTVDVQQIGPRQSAVGFATVNGWFHRLTNVHWMLYTLTDWLGLVPIVVCLLFAYVGLAQLVQRRSLLKVDLDILHYAVGIERYADTPFPSGTAAQEFGASALYQGFDRAVFGIYGRRAVAFRGPLAHGYCGSNIFERRIIFTV